MRPYIDFIGIDLGGARGKTTAVARARLGDGCCVIEDVSARSGDEPWTDEAILELVDQVSIDNTVVAIDAPLIAPSCVRCSERTCPGIASCEVESVVWMRTRGLELSRAAESSDAIALGRRSSRPSDTWTAPGAPVAPYTHRCTELYLHFERGIFPRELLGQGQGPIAARAQHLTRRLANAGLTLHENLIEVCPRATVHALFDEDAARGYKRDADPWLTRAHIIDGLGERLTFGPRSRLAREDVLRNDHCFDALLAAYTAYLYVVEDWDKPSDPAFTSDGWIYAPKT